MAYVTANLGDDSVNDSLQNVDALEMRKVLELAEAEGIPAEVQLQAIVAWLHANSGRVELFSALTKRLDWKAISSNLILRILERPTHLVNQFSFRYELFDVKLIFLELCSPKLWH